MQHCHHPYTSSAPSKTRRSHFCSLEDTGEVDPSSVFIDSSLLLSILDDDESFQEFWANKGGGVMWVLLGVVVYLSSSLMMATYERGGGGQNHMYECQIYI